MFVQDYRNDKGVRRINRLDKDGAMRFSGELDWIYTRVLEKARKAPVRSPWGFDVDALNAMKFRDHVEFDLLHEFVDGYFFDFHVDTKPNDGTMRTVNINVMLSARDAYEGGTLQVGAVNVTAEQGDMYFYPAAYPHKVHDITAGRRHTYIIAATAKNAALAALGADQSDSREQYFKDAKANHERLSAGYAAAGCETPPEMAAKLHWLHAEFLDAAGEADAADAKFADSYMATGQGPEYSAHFYNQGLAAIQAGFHDDGKKTLQMAVRVDPGNELAKKALASLGSATPLRVNKQGEL